MTHENCKGTWQPECFFANGSLETFTRPCNLNEYAAYVQARRPCQGKAAARSLSNQLVRRWHT